MSIRTAIRRLQEKAAAVEVLPLRGNFDVDGASLRIGDDRYEMIKVPPDGNCAFDTMLYIVHTVVNMAPWKGPADAYEKTNLGGPDELRKALDAYREGLPREDGWGDQFDWVVFCAMFGVTVHVVSYEVTAVGFGNETHSVITPEALGREAFLPAFSRVHRDSVNIGLHAYVCNHYGKHYDPMRLIERA